MPLQSRDAPSNVPARPLEENFAHTEAAIHRTPEAESNSIDRCATNVNPDGTVDQGELERLAVSVWSVQREAAAARLPKAAQLASVPGLATVSDGIWPPHSLEPDYLARRDALRGPRTMIKMSFLIVGILSVPMTYYFWMGGWDTIPGASSPEVASFNSKPIIPPPKSSSEEETTIARGGDPGTRVQAEPRGAKSSVGKAIAMSQPGMPEARDPHSSTAARALDLPKPPSQQKTPIARDDSPRTPGQTESLTPKSSAGETIRGAIEPAPTIRGVTDNEIRLGISTASSPTATTGQTALEAQTSNPAAAAASPTATTDRTAVEAQTSNPAAAAASPTATTGRTTATSRTAVAPVPPSDQSNADETVVLLERGQELMRHGDLAAARLVLRHAADAKNAEAALILGLTYDPVILRELRVYGLSADVGVARTWYEKAKELGSPEAARRLDNLGH